MVECLAWASIRGIKSMIIEDQTLNRQKADYETDCQKVNRLTTGILGKYYFHRVTGFHETENVTLDSMHDTFKSCEYVAMVNILNFLIYEKIFFELNELNEEITKVEYGTYT